MANPLQQASTIRKVIYLVVIVLLFTLTLFWRGTIPLPLSGDQQALAGLNQASILNQAKKLELRELEQGDPNIFGSAAMVALSGTRGVVVSGLWRAAIEKQKKNEFGELENIVRLVTKLQPNFRVPWLFQSWNLAYNVSVENERLGDMYFYISRGIELLAEGERLNKLSPDMRHMTGFYYQNKFGVSDKVNTLRSLMQVSCIPPAEREPKRFLKEDKTIDMKEFEDFCRKNPQLVRRLREKLNCNLPEQVVKFLEDNAKIPSRYDLKTLALAEAEMQFPILPRAFPQGANEYHSESSEFDDHDKFDAFHAARAWFTYSQLPLPPSPKDELGQAIPTGIMELQGEDRFRYRIPKSPALILFRNTPARAQTYLADRLMKEGWYDSATTWKPDELRDSASHWFKSNPNLSLKASDDSMTQWELSYRAWEEYGKNNGMLLSQSRMEQLQSLASKIDPQSPLLSYPKELIEQYGRSVEEVEARKAMTALEQNLRVTNFWRFMSVSQAEQQKTTVEARKLFGEAEQLKSMAEYQKALPSYIKAMNLWRQVLINNPKFHRGDQAREGEEEYYEILMKMVDLQLKELEIGDGKRRFELFTTSASGLLGGVGGHEGQIDLKYAFAEDEVLTKVTELDSLVQQRIGDVTTAIDAGLSPIVMQADSLKRNAPVRSTVARSIVNKDFAWLKTHTKKGDLNEPWVVDYTVDAIRSRLNLVRKISPDAPAPDAPPVPEKMPAQMPK